MSYDSKNEQASKESNTSPCLSRIHDPTPLATTIDGNHTPLTETAFLQVKGSAQGRAIPEVLPREGQATATLPSYA